MRVDGAHGQPEVVENERLAAADQASALGASQNERQIEIQWRAQAEELAERLQHKQRELERREARMNATMAEAEAEVRATRVWAAERVHELRQQEETLKKQTAEAEQDQRAFAAARLAWEDEVRLSGELLARSKKRQKERREIARQRHRALESQASALRTAQARLEAERQTNEREHLTAQQQWALERENESLRLKQLSQDIEQRRDALQEREQRFDADQQEAAQRARQFESDVAVLAEERETLQRLQDQHREMCDAQRKSANERQHRQTEILRQKQEEMTRNRERLERLRNEVMQTHRNALEMRLATEEIWARINQHAKPEQVTQTLAAIRNRVSDEYRLANESLAERYQELQALGQKIVARQSALQKQRNDAQHWVVRRREEIEQEAARIIVRERELEKYEHDLRRQQMTWRLGRNTPASGNNRNEPTDIDIAIKPV